MIKINLSSAPKQLDISNVGGFDFSKIKPVWVIIAIVIVYIPETMIVPIWEESRAAREAELTVEKSKLKKLTRSIGDLEKEEKQISELKIQEENLKKKLQAVNQAISEKKNPASILLYLAKNIPQDLWIKDLVIEDDAMVIKGEASNYTSVGNFVANLRASVFIKDASIVSTSSNVRESDKKRIEAFEIKFLIARYE